MRKRTVVIRATVEYVVEVPEDWEAHDVEFNRNEGSGCANRIQTEMERLATAHGCLCGLVDFAFVREASIEDEATLGVRSIRDAATAEAVPPSPRAAGSAEG